MPDSERDLRAIEVSIGDGETICVEATPSGLLLSNDSRWRQPLTREEAWRLAEAIDRTGQVVPSRCERAVQPDFGRGVRILRLLGRLRGSLVCRSRSEPLATALLALLPRVLAFVGAEPRLVMARPEALSAARAPPRVPA